MSPKAPWQSEIAASNSPAKASVAGVGPLEGGAGRRGGGRELDEAPADVHAVHDQPPPGQLVGVATGAAPDVEHPHAGLQVEGLHEEPDLLVGALGERVPQVGDAQVLGDGLEPVVVPAPTATPSRRPSCPPPTG